MKDTLFISDIFRSIQGEGPKIGTPSIFLRLGMCNLHCTWCDTPYTWKPGMTDYKPMTLEQVAKKVAALRKGRTTNNLVITGGEPLLQQKNLATLLTNSVTAKAFKGMEIEFETNGSQILGPDLAAALASEPAFKPSFNISPKLADSGNKPYKVHFYANSVLKFVYVSKKSEVLIDAFLKENSVALAAHKPATFIMPEGTSAKAMEKKAKAVLEYCTKRGFRYAPRLHIYLFGDKRAT